MQNVYSILPQVRSNKRDSSVSFGLEYQPRQSFFSTQQWPVSSQKLLCQGYQDCHCMLNLAQECLIAWNILILCYDIESCLFLCNTQRRPANMTMGCDVTALNTYLVSLAQAAFRHGNEPPESITKSREWAQPRSGWRVKDTRSSHSRNSNFGHPAHTFLTVVFETINFKTTVNVCLYTFKKQSN
jgi:hypothetical protein